jgi:hypothetical protein
MSFNNKLPCVLITTIVSQLTVIWVVIGGELFDEDGNTWQSVSYLWKTIFGI